MCIVTRRSWQGSMVKSVTWCPKSFRVQWCEFGELRVVAGSLWNVNRVSSESIFWPNTPPASSYAWWEEFGISYSLTLSNVDHICWYVLRRPDRSLVDNIGLGGPLFTPAEKSSITYCSPLCVSTILLKCRQTYQSISNSISFGSFHSYHSRQNKWSTIQLS